jgi:hypothetical protein
MEPMITDLNTVKSVSSMDAALHAAFASIGFEIRKKD